MKSLKNWLLDLVRGSRARARARALRAEQLENLLIRMAQLEATNTQMEREMDELRSDSRRIAELRILVEDELWEIGQNRRETE